MTTPPRPQIDCDQQHTSVFVSDLERAIDFYVTRLGFTLAFTWGEPPSFAGVSLDRTQIFLDRSQAPNPAGCCLFFNVGDVDELQVGRALVVVCNRPCALVVSERGIGR